MKTDIFLQFEPNAFEEFTLAVKLAMQASGEWDGASPFVDAVIAFVQRTSAALTGEHERVLAKVRAVENGSLSQVRVDLSDVAAMKLLADALLLQSFAKAARQRATERSAS